MKRGNFRSANLGESAPLPDLLLVDPLVVERTRFNADRTHRFTLFRHWGDPEDYVAGICMNPSGAAEHVTDNTVNKLTKMAREYWGAGAYYQLNVLSVRVTDSAQLATASCINLPENDQWIRQVASKAKFVVVGWGNPGHATGRGPEVAKILREVCDPAKVLCFGKNLNGAPVHPLYQPFAAKLIPYF